MSADNPNEPTGEPDLFNEDRPETTDGPGLTDEERDAVAEAEDATVPVSYSGTDFDVEGLVRRLVRGDIVVPTFGGEDESLETAGFQRSFVWKRPQMDKFIESLLLGFPIPGIMLVEQQDKRYLVLDGQQRLATLRAFYGGVHDKVEFSLKNVAKDFRGLTYKTLSPEQRRQLDNTFIQATIVKTDGSEESLDSVYQVFERLNSGGTQLTPHEIRIALYAGPFVDYLADLNHDENWRKIYGPLSPRLRDQELILRAIAFFVASATYRRPLKKFLNEFVGEHRRMERLQADRVAALFRDACAVLVEGPGRAAIRPGGKQINAAITEAVFVGLMRRLEAGPVEAGAVTDALTTLEGERTLGTSLTRATADEESVRTRLSVYTSRLASA